MLIHRFVIIFMYIKLAKQAVIQPSSSELLEAIININTHLNQIDTHLNQLDANIASIEGEIQAIGERTSITLANSEKIASIEGEIQAIGKRTSTTLANSEKIVSIEGEIQEIGKRTSSIEGEIQAIGERTSITLANTEKISAIEGEIQEIGKITSITLANIEKIASIEGEIQEKREITVNKLDVLKHLDEELNATSAFIKNTVIKLEHNVHEIQIFNTDASEQLKTIINDTGNMRDPLNVMETTLLSLDHNMEQIKTSQNNTAENFQNIQDNMEELKTPLKNLNSINDTLTLIQRTQEQIKTENVALKTPLNTLNSINDMVTSIQRTQEQINDNIRTETGAIKDGVTNIQNTVDKIPSRQPCRASDGFILSPAGDQCFRPIVDEGTLSWDASLARCQDMGMTLAEPNNAVALWLQGILNGKHGNKDYWVGGRGGSDSRYTWQGSSSQVINSNLWLPGQPTGGGSSSYCVVMTAHNISIQFYPGKPYFDNPCSDSTSWYPLCEQDILE